MNKLKLLFLSEVSSSNLLRRLNNEFEVFFNIEDLTTEDFVNINVLWTHLNYKIDEKFLSKYPNVKYIVSPVTGINHLDIDYINRSSIKLITLREEKNFLKDISATAEHTWAIFLALQKNILRAHQSIVSELSFVRNNFDAVQLSGKSIGIIGFGRIGKMISRYAHSFRMNVFYYDVNDIPASKKYSYQSLENLLIKSDFIFLTASYTPKYHHFFNIEKFKLMKSTSIFVNTSRGELVNELDLIYSLKNKLISGAALDVFDNELNFDCKSNDLVNYSQENSNLILTPHIGGRSADALDLVETYLYNKLKRIINE
jgi:D-3-phosphoglycerate dehydrogenase